MKRPQTFGLILAALVVLIVAAIFSVSLILKSESFRRYAIRKITEAAQQATGGKTEISTFDFSLSTLTAHLYGVTLHGTESPGHPPLLRVQQLTVGFKIQSVLRRKIYLSNLEILHPVAHVEVDRNGRNNFPQPPPRKSTSQTSVFDLGVRRVLLSAGEVDYNDRKTPVDAEIYDLGAEIRFDLPSRSYSGSISYANSHIKYAQYASLPHSLKANFNASSDRMTVDPAQLTIGSSSATLRATIQNYSHPNLDGDYNIRIHTPDFAAFASDTNPAGDILLTGKLQGTDFNEEPLLRALVINGEVSSDALSAAASSGRIEGRKLRGKYELANGSLHATDVSLESLGGVIKADMDMQHLDGTPSTSVRSTFRGISLRLAQQALRRPELRQVALSGILDGKSQASWTGSIQNVRATSDITIRGESQTKAINASSTVPVPLDGIIHLTYDGRRSAIGLRSTTLHMPSATLTAQGEISDHSNLQVQANVSDLHQVIALAVAFRPHSPPPPALSGSATASATIRGSLRNPDINGELSAQNLKAGGSDWSMARASFKASPWQFAISDATLVNAHRGRVIISANVVLHDWSYSPSAPIRANISVQQIAVADLQHLANTNYAVSGDLSAQISVSGSQVKLEGSGAVQIVKGSAYGEELKTAEFKFRAEGESVKSSATVVLAAGSAHADLSFTPKTKAYTVRLDAPTIVLQKLSFVQAKNLPLAGTLNASASGTGTLDNPQLDVTVALPTLTVRDKSISGIKAQLQVANHKAAFNLDSQVVEATVHAHGQVSLTGNYDTDAVIDTTSIPLEVLFATYFPSLPQGFKGQTELHATLKGPLKNKSQLEAHLTIPAFNATYASLQIGAAGPIRADYSHSIVTVQPVEIRGTETSLRVQGSIPLAGNTTPTLTAQGSIDLRVAKVFLPDIKSSGVINLDVHAAGTANHPSVNGQIRLEDVAVIQPGAPLGVEKLNGALHIDNDRINLTGISGQVGGGQLSAGGSITYRPSMEFNLALQAHSIRLRYPDGLRSLLDGNLALTGTKDSSVLTGRVLIDSLSFTPDFDLASFADQLSSQTPTPVQPGFADTVRLSIAVQSQENLNASSSQVSIAGRVNLNVGGTASDPVITGRADLTSGELFYRNVRYQVQRGIITFDDPNQTAPVLNLSVTSTVEQYNLTLNLRGPFDRLTTSYVSDPPLATADIINLLATGQTTSQSAASQSTDSMIASQAAGQLTGSVQKLAGLSSLQIDPLIGGSNQNPSARIAVQQRVTKNFLFTFSTDVSQPGSEIVEGDYQINKRWSLSVARQEAGGISAEGRYHTRF